MYVKGIGKISNCIFPIFFEQDLGNNKKIGVLGTGFFIDDNGTFVTANHVVSAIPSNSKLLYLGNIPNNPNSHPIYIKEIYKDIAKDVFVGTIEYKSSSKVMLSEKNPPIGKSICLCGYPLALITQNTDKSINTKNVRQYWQPTYVIDNITLKKDGITYIGFITQHPSLRGMSGGPVFDMEGTVYGIDVATLTREIPENNQQNTSVPTGVVVGVDVIHPILSNLKIKLN